MELTLKIRVWLFQMPVLKLSWHGIPYLLLPVSWKGEILYSLLSMSPISECPEPMGRESSIFSPVKEGHNFTISIIII